MSLTKATFRMTDGAEDADVSAICTSVFTDAVKAAYAAHLAEGE